VVVLVAVLGVDYHFVAKGEVRSMPFVRTFLRKARHYAFNRADSSARLQQAEEIEHALGRGEFRLCISGRNLHRAGRSAGVHLGAFKAAIAAGRPVVPVALDGTRRVLRTAPGCRALLASQSRFVRRSFRNPMQRIGTKSCACAMPRGK